MDSSNLTPEQCRLIRDQLGPIQRYLHALLERTRQQAFPADDNVRHVTETAYNAVHELSVELHYLSVPHGVGRPPKEGGFAS
jgi:hypothetical protein